MFEKPRLLRKGIADERGAPPYVIFTDVSLRNMAREYPESNEAFLQIPGVGEKKLDEFGYAFMKCIEEYLETAPKVKFEGGPTDPYASTSRSSSGSGLDLDSKPATGRQALSSTVLDSLDKFGAGQNVQQIAQNRSLSPETIYGHLEQAVRAEVEIDLKRIFSPLACQEIRAALKDFDGTHMKPVVESLGGRYGYGLCKLFVAWTEKAAEGKAPELETVFPDIKSNQAV